MFSAAFRPTSYDDGEEWSSKLVYQYAGADRILHDKAGVGSGVLANSDGDLFDF